MKSPIKDYKFQQKDQWRRQIWNELADRVSVRPRDALVIYLAGREDLDRRTAMGKGFHTNNLIAIDSDQSVVDGIREFGGLAICAEIEDVMWSWPDDVEVNGVILDYCGGISKERLSGIVGSFISDAFTDTVYVTNQRRGQDPFVSTYYRLFDQGEGAAHRGVANLHFAVNGLLGRAVAMGASPAAIDVGVARCIEAAEPTYTTYKSKNANYDGAVFNNPLGAFNTKPLMRAERTTPKNTDTVRKIAATLAHRTRRTF